MVSLRQMGALTAGDVRNQLTQTSSSAMTYAGGGAWGQQGTASWTNSGLGQYVQGTQFALRSQRMPDRFMYQAQMQVTIPQQRIYMPNTWSAWNNSDDTSYTTETVESNTYDFPQRVWGAWMEHERDCNQQAAYLLNEQGIEEVRRENARREAQYQQQRAQYESPEAVAERERLAQERLDKAAKETERKEAAEEVAQILLGELIGEEQLEIYQETGRIFVNGKRDSYLLTKSGGVQRVERGKIVDLCVHVQEKILLPPADNVIGLAMHIKADEKDFNKVANASNPKPRPKQLALAANY